MAADTDELAPDAARAARVLPAPLCRALDLLFTDHPTGVMLVGGSALAGYYAGHRRSDDLDLFTADSPAQDHMRRAVQALPKYGATLTSQQTSPGFFHALAALDGHEFTVDVVLDENLFRVGHGASAGCVQVADLRTILMMKAATLVSRCSEKDLYDLLWLLSHFEKTGPAELVKLGQAIDGGAHAESILIVLTGTRLSVAACNFALPGGPEARDIHAKLSAFRDALARAFDAHLRQEPCPPLGQTIRQLRLLVT
jgi:hypothetical protein